MNQETLLNHISLNLSQREIAKAEDCSQSTIKYWLKRYNLKTHTRKAQKVNITPRGTIKRCPKCLESKELYSNFYVRPDGRFHAWCKLCNDKNVVERQRQGKREAVSYKGGGCIICGYNKYIGALEFHHLDPSQKDFSISNIKNYKLESIKNELDKCILVCCLCHREIHGGLISLSKVGVAELESAFSTPSTAKNLEDSPDYTPDIG